jgi:hypothetical protein
MSNWSSFSRRGYEPGGEGLAALVQVGIEGPVLAPDESLDLLLALDDHAQGRALDAPGGQAALDLLPQQRREVEAHQVVQRAPRLLGVDQIEGQAAGMLDGLLHRPLCDLVEHHALHVLVVQHTALLEQLVEVPGNGLALAVRVGGQVAGNPPCAGP